MKNKIIPALFALPLLATSASAAIILNGVDQGATLTLTGSELRTQDLDITAAGDVLTYDSSSAIIGGPGNTTINVSTILVLVEMVLLEY